MNTELGRWARFRRIRWQVWMAGAIAMPCLAFICLAAAAPHPCCQDTGLFSLPKLKLTEPEAPQECGRAMERAAAILAEIEPEIAESVKSAIRKGVAEREPGESEAEAWDAAASLALLNKDPASALWAELNALRIAWRSHYAAQAGVYLAMLNKGDDAKLLLHCAYSAGNRSPYLLEALANLYRKSGDKAKAVQHIGEALQEAPDDEFIRGAKAMINTGAPPPPAAAPADAVDACLAELRAHLARVVAAVRQQEQLRARVQRAFYGSTGPPDDSQEVVAALREGYDQSLESLREPARLAKLSKAQLQQQFPGSPDSVLVQFRNGFYYSAICIYLGATENLLQGGREAEIDEGFNVGFWAPVIGLEPVQYARVIRSLRDFEYQGIRLNTPGYRWEDWGGAYFETLFRYANDRRREGHQECMRQHPSNMEAQKACELEVDRKFCATSRRLHTDWTAETERLHQRLGRRFDGVASAVLIEAGSEADDAFLFASKYALEMKVAPSDAQGKEWIQDLNARYRKIVDEAVGPGDNGPAATVRRSADTYRIYRTNATTSIEQFGKWIEEICQPVDRRVFEELLEEQRKAVSSMLWDRLVRDLNAKWDSRANCSLSFGKWFTIEADIEGKVGISGKWKFGEKKFDEGESVEVGRKYKVDIKDGEFRGVSVSVEGTGKAGAATGKGGITLGAEWNSKTQSWNYPVKVSTKLGLGYKKKLKGGGEAGFT